MGDQKLLRPVALPPGQFGLVNHSHARVFIATPSKSFALAPGDLAITDQQAFAIVDQDVYERIAAGVDPASLKSIFPTLR